MRSINRRRFLSISAIAGASAVVPQITGNSEASAKPVDDTGKKFVTRVLGKTGLEIPILSMGVMKADNPAVVRAAYNSGLTHFDTAHTYQNGKNEEMLGVFFKDKDRSTFTIATKGKPNLHSASFEQDYEELLNTSLRRLKMKYVDIFYTHAIADMEVVNNPRLIKMLKKFKDDGKIRHIGFSTHANKPAQIDEAIATGIYEVCLVSYNFKLDILPELDAAIQRGVEAGIGFVAMKSMVGGVEDVNAKSAINGAACLRWVWQNPNITTAIPGFTSFDLLDNCLEAARSPKLEESDIKYIAGLREKELLYCQNCGNCVKQCSKHLPVPDIMRAYMYNYGYRNPSLSKDTLVELAVAENACSGCEKCTVTRCSSGFNIAEKIAAITPLVNVPSHFLT